MQRSLAPPRIIERPHLRRLLLDSLENSHVLLTAPAGYGKSMALRDLERQLPHARLITITQADLDLAALQARLAPLLAAPHAILLDDAHLLAGGPEVCAWLQQQLAQRTQRWLLAGRRMPFDPELLLLSGQAVQLGQAVLAFSLAETAVLLSQPEERIAKWHQRLAGWSLAVSLLSRLPPDADPLPDTEAHLFTYLTQAVFAQLPARLKQFMQVTAVPLQFNRTLAAALWADEAEAAALLQEIIRADLYIHPANEPGWYRYHDLIRDYLRRDFKGRKAVAETAVAWFQAQDMAHMAVDQALDAGLQTLAARQIGQMPLSHFHKTGSYLTYRRWVRALDEETLTANPLLLLRLANVLQLLPGYKDEARDYTERAIRLAAAQGDERVRLLGQTNLALWHYKQGELAAARRLILAVLADPDCGEYPRLFALRIASLILSDAGHYREARPYFAEAIALAQEMATRNEPFMNRANMAAMYLLPLGQIEQAEAELTAVLTHFADSPGWLGQYLTYWCALQAAKGDWAGLAAGLERLDNTLMEIREQSEKISLHTQIWQAHYQTLLAVALSDDAQAQAALARYDGLTEYSPLNRDCVGWLACWHLRRRGEWANVWQRGEQALVQPIQFAYYRAQIALEMNIAQGMRLLAGESDDLAWREEANWLAQWRSRGHLLRLRALLAVIGWHRGDWRWRRHWTAVTRQLRKPSFSRLLTQRDPELGVWFWRTGLEAGVDAEWAAASLVEIGQYEPLLPLLQHKKGAIRQQTAHILAEIGDEQAMVGLTAALAQEKQKTVRQAMENAVNHLENQPPPPLTIQLMGNFALWRGSQPVPAASWYRPIVLRLFQYFAINAGRPLPKEKILDDLWPDTDPAKAWGTFRTVYSRLRKLIEPYMRPKAANRYISLSNDTYTFDPEGQARIDVVQFQQIVSHALRRRDTKTVAAIPEPLVEALQSYAPLLPDLPYAEWLLEPRQRVQELYVEGCLFLAQAYLVRGENGTAVTWARQTITAAPWLEEAYQLLMRGYARQGQRALALRVYNEAAANLKQELNLEPSPLTQQLADSLRAGKSI